MAWRAMGVLTFIAGLAVGSGLRADDPKDTGKQPERLGFLLDKLNLSDRQQQEIRKVEEDYDAKADPVEHHLWTLYHEEIQKMKGVLTSEQSARLPQVLKAMRHEQFEKIADRLKLTPDERQKVEKLCEEYEPKFHELASTTGKHADAFKEFRHLRRKLVRAIRNELTPEQRAQLPALIREEHRHWRNATVRHEALRKVGQQLGVNNEQQQRLEKIESESSDPIKTASTELHKLHEDERAAIDKILTAEQRARLQSLHQGTGASRREKNKD